jgi:hypothetical protein
MKKTLLIIYLIILSVHLHAQDNSLSFRFSDILFRDLVDTIEKRVEVKIYYSNKWVDSLYLNVDAKNDSIESLLSRSLKKEGFSFIVTENNKIILTKGYTIKTNFKDQYNAYLRKIMVKPDSSYYIRPVQLQETTTVNDEYKVFKIGRPSESSKSDKAILSGVVVDPVSGNPVA